MTLESTGTAVVGVTSYLIYTADQAAGTVTVIGSTRARGSSARTSSGSVAVITFDTSPDRYRHWKLTVEPPIATLTLDVGEDSGRSPDYQRKLDSALRVDIELNDAVQRVRFEHPEVGAVVVTGGKDKVFSTGVDIPMLAQSPHSAKVNVYKFTNETRCAIEDASANSRQRWLAALNGTASGSGYELALATDEILLIDDGNSAVSLPEAPLFGVLPGTGGLIRLVDKRRVRPDLADVFATLPDGVGGERARNWGLVDEIVPRDRFAEVVRERALAAAGDSPRPPVAERVELTPLQREEFDGGFCYPNLRVDLSEEAGTVTLTVVGPAHLDCFAPEPGPQRLRAIWWPLAACRELDDALLLLRTNWPELDTLVLRTEGDPLAIAAADAAFLTGYESDWFVREVVLYWKRTLKRLEVTFRSVLTLIEPGSCFVGTLLEFALASDRAYMLDGASPDRPDTPPAEIALTGMNFGLLPRSNGLTRLQTRFLGWDDHVTALAERVGELMGAAEAAELGVVTDVTDVIDWEEEVRLVIEARASSPDTLIGREANLRAAGPDTLETKLFSVLTAW